MKTHKTVYLLGSGFSKAAGAPLGRELMEKIFDQHDKPNINKMKHWIYKHIFPTKKDWISNCEIDELISRLTLHCYYNNQCQHTSEILNVIIKELANSVNCQLDKADFAIYRNFIERLKPRDTVITLNYDTILERSGIKGKTRNLLKLHGSISWSWCSRCKYYTFHNSWQTGMICPKCHYPLLPLIVPPQITIAEHYSPLIPFYNYAINAIKKSDRIVIIGYSLPATDYDIKMLLLLGIKQNPRKIPIYIINGPHCDIKNYEILRRHLIKIKMTAEDWLKLQ